MAACTSVSPSLPMSVLRTAHRYVSRVPSGVGLQVVTAFKYLGVLLGHVDLDEAYYTCIATAYQRPNFF